MGIEQTFTWSNVRVIVIVDETFFSGYFNTVAYFVKVRTRPKKDQGEKIR